VERGVIIGTAGHIDHGKTALVRALTGIDTDRLPEEKRRGITIDLGFAPLTLDGVGVVGVVDVPGHEDFVRSMLVGATGIDLALLVIAADEGIMPQTREHLLILELLEISQIVVALTKSDLVDDEWLSLVRNDVQDLLAESNKAGTKIVSCSTRTAAGIAELRSALAAALMRTRARAPDDLFRLPVDRAFTVKGTGTVVTGTVWSGELAADASVTVLPGGRKTRARRIEQHGTVTGMARAGARAAIALTALDVGEVPRGSVLVTDESWEPTTLFEALVTVAPGVAETLSPRAQLRLHAGASEVGARLTFGADAQRGSRLLARVTADAPLTLRGGDRFVLRLPAPVRTIGGGVVTDTHARRRPLPGLAPLEMDKLSTDAAARLRFVVDASAMDGVSIASIPVRIGCTPEEMPGLLTRVDVRRGSHNLFAPQIVEQVMATVQRIVAEYEIRSPLSPGIPARTLIEALHASEELADIAIREMKRSGKIEVVGPTIRRAGWEPAPTSADLDVGNHLAHDICAGEREPPSVGELVSRYGSSVPALLRFLERQGRIIQVEMDRYYDRSTVEALIAKLKGRLIPGRNYGPGELREVLGFSRKYLIPFLEFCDRRGVTERHGGGRVLKETSGHLLDTSTAQS
jgi:selenocysteine-specific elongation factor